MSTTIPIPIPIEIDKARYWALTTPHAAFYGSLASQLRDIIDPTVPTASTDGAVIRWNPDFVAKLTPEEVRFVLLHETLHCAHDHFNRLPITSEGNEAGDYAINAILERIAGLSMPKGGLRDKRYDDMAEEEILAAIRRKPDPEKPEPEKPDPNGGKPDPNGGKPDPNGGKPDPNGQPDPTDVGGCGGFEAPAPPAPVQGKTPPPTMKEKWDRALVQADQASRSLGRGNAPAELQRLLDALKAPSKLNWKDETADFLRSAIATRNDWTRSARRHALAATIIPSRRVDSTGLVVFVRDTSGSIDDKITAEFTALISQCCADLGCEALVMDCDTIIHAEYRLGAGEEAPLHAKGGGGTDFTAPFERVAELIEEGERVAGLVYLTDLEGREPEGVDIATLWLSTTANVAQTGRTVRIEV